MKFVGRQSPRVRSRSGLSGKTITCMLNARNNQSYGSDIAQAFSREGTTLPGGYELITLVATGSIGAFYKARDSRGRLVGVKMLHNAQSETAVASLRREIEASRRIAHSGVVRILDKGTTLNGEPFVVMEYIEGESLESQRLQKGGRLSVTEVILTIFDILVVLEATHAARVVHLDLKPHNVMVVGDNGSVKLIDFGMASFSRPGNAAPDDDPRTNNLKYIMGTLGFMAPEQARGEFERMDARSDIFAIGATMHQLLTGRLPNGLDADAMGPLECLRRRAFEQTEPIAEIACVPKPVADVVDTALRLDPTKRYPSARMMRAALRHSFDCIPA